MTYDSTLFKPTQICLDIAVPEVRSGGWNADLNQLCVEAILPWLQEDYLPQAKVFPNRGALASFWELVNGTAITLQNRRLVLMPTEAIDLDELRIPQEWVDIPSWAADYYLAVQVNPDDGWVRLGGVATHRQVKAGFYDGGDRTYCLNEGDLIPDFGTLWVAQQLNPSEVVQADVTAIPPLPLVQAENLIQRLGNAEVLNPRLAVPFELWSGLLNHGGWRQRLAERRWGLAEVRSPLQWLRSGISDLASGWERMELQFSGARGEEAESVVLARQLVIADQAYELRVMNLAENNWRFELRSLVVGGMVPAGFVLRLLTEDLQPFAGNEDRAMTAVEQLYLEVALESGEGLVWQVEPVPEEYDFEILRF
jgi:Protein of unknown function (DUF1822)